MSDLAILFIKLKTLTINYFKQKLKKYHQVA